MFKLAGLLALALAFNLRCGRASTAADGGAEPGVTRAVLAQIGAVQPAPVSWPSFAEWKTRCDRLPSNRSLNRTVAPKHLLPLKSYREFDAVLEAYFDFCKRGRLAAADSWLGEQPRTNQFFNVQTTYYSRPPIPFQPFAQKVVVPANSEVIFHGDLHGDIHSLIGYLDWLERNGYLRDFKLARPNRYLVFLGDYTDRGLYGIEVLYTVLRLQLANPELVILVRGNHEDASLTARYGFLYEGNAKYGREFNLTKVARLYDFLPVVLYLGCGENFLQCNHGGMEPGFDPRELLDAPGDLRFRFLGMLQQQRLTAQNPDWAASVAPHAEPAALRGLHDFLPQTPTSPKSIGFLWNDFSLVPGESDLRLDLDRGFVYGERAAQSLLKASSSTTKKVQAVFRAHQHSGIINPMMRRLKASRGVFRHWQSTDSVPLLQAREPELEKCLENAEERSLPPGSVWTFNVSPDSVYGEGCNFHFDTFGILQTSQEFKDWRLRVVNQTIAK